MAPTSTHTGHLPQWPPPAPVRQAQIRKHFKPRRPSPSGCKPSIDPTTVFPPARYDVITGITKPSAKTENPLAKAVRVIRFPCHKPAMRFVSTDGWRTKGRRFGASCTSPPLAFWLAGSSYPTHSESEDGICASFEMLVATAETVRRHNQQTIMWTHTTIKTWNFETC